MVQKEVADRMKAGPGSKDYGALSAWQCSIMRSHILAANVPPQIALFPDRRWAAQ